MSKSPSAFYGTKPTVVIFENESSFHFRPGILHRKTCIALINRISEFLTPVHGSISERDPFPPRSAPLGVYRDAISIVQNCGNIELESVIVLVLNPHYRSIFSLRDYNLV